MSAKKSKKSQSVQSRYGRLKLKDVAEQGEIQIRAWELDDPERSYHARVVGVRCDFREVTTAFAQVLPGSSHILNAVLVSLPRQAMKETLQGFGGIRERLKGLKITEEELAGASLEWELLESLEQRSYLGLRADIVRAACSDDAAIVDFFSRPLVTEALVEARPDQRLSFPGEIRVACSALVLAAFLQQADAEASGDGDY